MVLLSLQNLAAIAVFSLAGLALLLVLLRWINGWLFQINDIIKMMKLIILELKRINSLNNKE